MNERTKTGLEILQAAILLGVTGDVLLRTTPWGLNVLLFVVMLAAAMLMLILKRRAEFWNAPTIALNAALVFFAAMFVWRDSTELKIFDTLAILTILAILTLPVLRIKLPAAGISHYLAGFFRAGISAAFMPFLLAFDDIKWSAIPQNGWSKHLVSVLRGLAIALPILLIFGALFVAADAIFEGLVNKTFNIDGSVLVGHIIFTGIFAWITAGYLRGSLLDYTADEILENPAETEAIKPQNLSITAIKDEDAPPISTAAKETKKRDWQNFDNSVLPRFFTLGAIEISIVLGLINLLFLSFVIVQIPYLFGGFEFVRKSPDFNLAEYARRGFGELVTVAALVLPILLVSHWLLRKDNRLNEKIYRVLAGMNIVLLFVIMISAAQRLLILTGNLGYGLTTIRLYPMICMIWLALIFILFSFTVLRGARRQFAWGALWATFFVLAATHCLNPDDYIVRHNINLMRQGRAFDADYNAGLSDDAVPVLLENLPAMNFTDGCAVKYKLSDRWREARDETDFRSWNWSRRTAKKTFEQNAENLAASQCPADTRQADRFLGEY